MTTKTKRPPIPAELKIGDVVAIQDSREQRPLTLGMRTEVAALATGDYSVRGMEDRIAIERKSLQDYVQCVGAERERFDREMMRLRAYDVRAVVLECSWSDLHAGQWRGNVTPGQVLGSTIGWINSGVTVLPVGSHTAAAEVVTMILFHAARKRYRELRELTRYITDGGEVVE